jgi:hypothetical protein
MEPSDYCDGHYRLIDHLVGGGTGISDAGQGNGSSCGDSGGGGVGGECTGIGCGGAMYYYFRSVAGTKCNIRFGETVDDGT